MSRKTEDAGDAPRPGGYASPLGLLERLGSPKKEVDAAPILDLLALALLMSLVFTRFVVVPGARVDLPATELRTQHIPGPVAVLTIESEGMLFFDGGVYESGDIRRGFRNYVENVSQSSPVLLIKAEASMDLQAFLRLCRMAQEAGFAEVQITGEKAPREVAPFGGATGNGAVPDGSGDG